MQIKEAIGVSFSGSVESPALQDVVVLMDSAAQSRGRDLTVAVDYERDFEMRRHIGQIFFAALIITSLGSWAGKLSHATLSATTSAQIDPLPIMAMARHLPTLRWTDYSLVFAN